MLRKSVKRKPVGCAGILVSDTICGPVTAFPAEGELLAVDTMPTKAGGCAANVAIVLAKQGIPAEVAGCLGNDSTAQVLLATLTENEVGVDGISYSDTLPTSKTVILLIAGEDRRYIHSFGANADFTAERIDRKWVKNLELFYLGGLFLMPNFRLDELVELLEFCREQGVKTVIDVVIPQGSEIPNNLDRVLELTDYFLPNEDEARILTGSADPREQVRMLLERRANTVVITRGKKGVIVGKERTYWEAGILDNFEPVDPSGCGDAFAAGFVTGIVSGLDIPSCIRYGSVLGASAVRALGTTDGVLIAEETKPYLDRAALEIHSGGL